MSILLFTRCASKIIKGGNFFNHKSAFRLFGKRTMAGKALQEIDLRPSETHDEKNARLHRPLSPHLTIYKPDYTSILSIMHRMTGTVFSFYLACFAACAVFLPYDFEQVMQMVEDQHLPSVLIMFARLFFAFPFLYHSCNGVRHLIWDTATFMGLREVLITGLVMLSVVTMLVIVVVGVL